jgi:ketosteroid isomerase-like protein
MLLILLAATLAASSQATSESELDDAVRRYDQAQIKGDAAELGRLLASDYVLVNSSGDVETKAQLIADFTDPAYHLDPYVVQRAITRRWADGAVMGGVALLAGSSGGKRFSVCLRFADIWRHGTDGWKVVYTQAARAKPDDCTTSK